jgi:hypothetical protein
MDKFILLSMYIRIVRQKNKKTGEVYATHRLVEAYRNAQSKVRQQVLLNLGCHFSVPQKDWKLLADRIEEICQHQSTLFELEPTLEKEAHRIAKLVIQKSSAVRAAENKKSETENPPADYQTVDINSLDHQHIRQIGREYVGYHVAQQLNLDKILLEIGFNQKQANIALASIIGRLIHPGSELNTYHYLVEKSALDELLETDFSHLSLNHFYQIADQILKHKTKIEEKLYQREKDLFNLEEVITLFDITNTYFEGRCLSNKKAQYGRSKEKRSDCRLVSLGLVLDASGFPKKSEVFPGNIHEPKTLQQMLEVLSDHKKMTVVMDAGIATEENVTWLKASGYEYVVVSRKRKWAMPEEQEKIILKEEKNQLVQAVMTKNEETDELELYCHSHLKAEKSQYMISKSAFRYETALKKLSDGLYKNGCAKKYKKVLEMLGRLKEKNKRVSQFYEVSVVSDNEKENAISITWERKENQLEAKKQGIYCLRTNRKDLDAKQFWKIYTMLTELESSFRSLKSELGFRPVYHKKEDRIDAHLFISVISYHLLHTIRYQLKAKNIHASWETLREILETQCRITSTLTLKNGQTVQIRKTSSPDTNQYQIYKALGIDTHPGKTEKAYF